ncbi:hypothetical protein I79_001321 [Cricetulus griseus]|uniref:Uncharacterized protein n=1 Tax=Cricetulus griseus TaxID=10029 RepID=G3GUG2_CRIGR|nr:hypothetical protein I79_001321 [Cricetulus griseus]
MSPLAGEFEMEKCDNRVVCIQSPLNKVTCKPMNIIAQSISSSFSRIKHNGKTTPQWNLPN